MALIIMTLAVYWQVGNHEFINFDDNIYVTENSRVAAGITVSNIIWALTSVDVTYWIPVTLLSHMLDVHFYGMNPGGHHLTNVFIHAISTLLLFLLLFRLTNTVWRSFFVAAFFALHPLHVESVAWVAERKDVLSAFFWLLTIGLYCAYVAKRKKILYMLTLFSFLLGIMSKPMVVSLPAIMLLLDFWPLNRYRLTNRHKGLDQLADVLQQLKPCLIEKIPFFACSFLSTVVTIYAKYKAGAVVSFDQFPIESRIGNALLSYIKYIAKTVWPQDLAVFYPLPHSISLLQVLCALVVLLLVSAATIWFGRRYPYLPVGWFWYLITLLPVIGLAQAGYQALADRFTYIPHIGLFIMAAWGISDLTKRWRHREGIVALVSGALIMASAALTWQQLGHWRDNTSLYRHSLQVTAGNVLIHYNLGVALAGKWDLDAAIREFQEALRIKPNFPEAHIGMGLAFANKVDLDAAIKEYRKALRLDPNNVKAHSNLQATLAMKRLQDDDGA